MDIGKPVYNFKEYNSDGYFHVTEDCKHDLLCWLLAPGSFRLPKSLCFYSMDGHFKSGLQWQANVYHISKDYLPQQASPYASHILL